MPIPIDFVAGSHGNFLETVLNKYFHFVPHENNFTAMGTSHNKSKQYNQQKFFWANHWSKWYSNQLEQYEKVIAIKFEPDDLLLLLSVSLLRAGDLNIDNNTLELNTRIKLNNWVYQQVLDQIDIAYPFLDQTQTSIPRNILREFFKFGFQNHNTNGFWIEQQKMQYPNQSVFCFWFKDFYDHAQFVHRIQQLENWLNLQFDFSQDFAKDHALFLKGIPYCHYKQQCDEIINCVQQKQNQPIPQLSLFQESYINAQLENLYQREMPFHDLAYFTNTKDVLYYLEHQAPKL